ncbi:MAG: hypothetical protein NZL94_04190, partial [Meiothermus sp.]|nr:hypothetical protein [Meiothermus sp.]
FDCGLRVSCCAFHCQKNALHAATQKGGACTGVCKEIPVQSPGAAAGLARARRFALVGILAVNLEIFAGVGLYAALHGASPGYQLGREVLFL